MKQDFKKRLEEAAKAREDSDVEEMQLKLDQVVHIYMFYLVGIMFFIDKSVNYVDVTYLKYIRDLELVSDYT